MAIQKKLPLILSSIALNFLLSDSFSQVPTNGLVSFWPFNGNANDQSGNNHNGTVAGASLTSDRFGKDSSAYLFNGNNSEIIVPDADDLSFTANQFSVSFWIYSNPNPTSNLAILGKRESPLNNFEYLFRKVSGNDATYGNKLFFSGWNLAGTAYPYISNASTFTPDDTISTNQWENWTVTADGSELKGYRNGEFKFSYSRNTSSSFENGPGDLTIGSGGGYNATYYMSGKLDDIRIYNRALDSTEINAIFTEGFCFQTVYDTILIAVTDTLIINANLTGINPPNNINTIKIFPNPTNDHITISTGNFTTMAGYQIKVINTLSQTVYSQVINAASYFVDLNTFGGMGTYFVQIYDAQNNLIDIRKIILQ